MDKLMVEQGHIKSKDVFELIVNLLTDVININNRLKRLEDMHKPVDTLRKEIVNGK